MLGIYQLNGDSYRVCFARPPSHAPGNWFPTAKVATSFKFGSGRRKNN
jgi:hypothetical protein